MMMNKWTWTYFPYITYKLIQANIYFKKMKQNTNQMILWGINRPISQKWSHPNYKNKNIILNPFGAIL